MADAVLHKQADYVTYKREVDKLLRARFSLGFHVDRIVNLASAHTTEPETIRKLARKAILGGSTDKLMRYLNHNSVDEDVVVTIIHMVTAAIKVGLIFV